jgi:glycerophosphoryl diester phosphodiesterase
MKWKVIHQYALALLAFFAGCHVSQKAQAPMQDSFDKQGHRGCRGLMPENTLPAMVEALGLGVTTLELDVVITKDGKVLVSHEPWFGKDITTLPDGSHLPDEKAAMTHNIYGMTYAQTRAYDVGMKPHPGFPRQKKLPAYKPLLSEVFDTINREMMTRRRPPVRYNIEIKSKPAGDDVYHPRPGGFVDLVMGEVKRYGLETYVSVQSFDFRPLRELRARYPAIAIAMLIDGKDGRTLEQQIADLGFTPEIYSPHHSLVNRKLVEDCHARGIKVIPWTVNEKELIEKLKGLGVDGIITDYPDLF